MADSNPDASGGRIKPGKKSASKMTPHPSGKESHGKGIQILRALSFSIYFMTCAFTIVITQLIGAPLYFINKEMFYAYMATTKRYFGITITTMTHVWANTLVRISGDASVAGQIKATANGGVEFNFPERAVLIANHQIYTDWLYLWWVAYANRPSMHGHLYIILKESLKYIPVFGVGMMFYGFIFMSRKMSTDRPRLSHRLKQLQAPKTDPRTGQTYLDPMWLLLFPEGTNLSGNGRRKSANWAEKTGVKDAEHVLLPRSTGTFFILNELKGSVEYVYDCTVAYEGIPRGKYGEQIFGLNSTYFEGLPPKSVNLYWRRFRIADIPLDDAETFDKWLREEWYKKDALMEEYMVKGRFPPLPSAKTEATEDESKHDEYVETEVRPRYPFEVLQIFVVVAIVGLMWHNVAKVIRAFTG